MTHRAFSLLTNGRTLLVETGSEPRVRHPGRIVEVRAGRWLRIELANCGPALPEASADASLIVLISHCVWVFPAEVMEAVSPVDRMCLVAWPEVAEQLGGRQAPRTDRMLPIRCREDDGDEEQSWIATYTLDVGYGGLRVAYPRELAPGAPLRIELPTAQRLLSATCTVAWNRPIVSGEGDPMFAIGVRLEALSENARFRLYTLVHDTGRQNAPWREPDAVVGPSA